MDVTARCLECRQWLMTHSTRWNKLRYHLKFNHDLYHQMLHSHLWCYKEFNFTLLLIPFSFKAEFQLLYYYTKFYWHDCRFLSCDSGEGGVKKIIFSRFGFQLMKMITKLSLRRCQSSKSNSGKFKLHRLIASNSISDFYVGFNCDSR